MLFKQSLYVDAKSMQRDATVVSLPALYFITAVAACMMMIDDVIILILLFLLLYYYIFLSLFFTITHY